jgi:hypothetical protein
LPHIDPSAAKTNTIFNHILVKMPLKMILSHTSKKYPKQSVVKNILSPKDKNRPETDGTKWCHISFHILRERI